MLSRPPHTILSPYTSAPQIVANILLIEWNEGPPKAAEASLLLLFLLFRFHIPFTAEFFVPRC